MSSYCGYGYINVSSQSYYVYDYSFGGSVTCNTSLCNDVLKLYPNYNTMTNFCENNAPVGNKKLVYPKLNMNAVSVSKCYYCSNCTSFTNAVVKYCNNTDNNTNYYYYNYGPYACQVLTNYK